MSCNWPIVKLGDYCSKIGSGATPKGGNSVYLDNGEISLIRSQNIYNDGFKSDGLAYITPEAAQKLKNVIIEPNDVLINITGDSVARVCLAPNEFLPARVNQHVAILRVVPEEFDHRYLRYYLTSTKMQNYLLTIASTGGTRNALTKLMLESLEVSKPPLNVQKKIGDVLEQFENKILINTKTNQTLEEMAQAIFKSWFVEFDPVKAKMNGELPEGMDAATASLFPDKLVESELGLIPEGWEVCLLNQKSEIKYGKNLPKTKLLDEGYPVFGGNGVIGYYSSYLYEDEQVLVSCRGAASGKVLRSLPKSFITNNSLVIDLSNSVLNINYVEPYLKGCNLEEYTSGSAQPQMTVANMAPVQILVPSEDILKSFDEVVKPLKSKIRANERQNLSLAALRDTLLPKLLSGEIELGTSEELVEAI
ncbi:TPA: restriction endonuclease subunit S [Vibrio parahaemolyticus]|nr:restriction endonuclease subunit S [Vibrio parahaemolyticus]